MQSICRALLAVAAVIGSAVPALAQTATPASSGPSLIWVWVWILVAGIIIMIIGTSAGANGNRR